MIKIGIIGMSAGNAHPYSWSSIINGCFDAAEISKVGYPAVAAYLEANAATLGINAARVTHVWSQDIEVSKSIAKTTKIEHVVTHITDLIGKVDAVILGRDDAENHREMAEPFIAANIPIFIDKPLTINLEDLNYYAAESNKGKLIMSCSSVRYASECLFAKASLQALGKVELVTAVGKKDWIKYGVHLLEGIFSIFDDPTPVSVKHIGTTTKDIVHIEFEDGLQAVIHLFMDIVPTSQISIFGQKGWQLIEIKNSYAMFRDNIIEFVRSVEEGKSRIPFRKTETIIKTLIAANMSLQNGGSTVYIKKI